MEGVTQHRVIKSCDKNSFTEESSTVCCDLHYCTAENPRNYTTSHCREKIHTGHEYDQDFGPCLV